MATRPNVIRVPKASGKSFNPHRLVKGNALLLNQLKHLRTRESEIPVEQRTAIDLDSMTEGQAADYIRKMMALLHPQASHGGKTK
jgi:hypothetical protein